MGHAQTVKMFKKWQEAADRTKITCQVRTLPDDNEIDVDMQYIIDVCGGDLDEQVNKMLTQKELKTAAEEAWMILMCFKREQTLLSTHIAQKTIIPI